MTWRAEPRLVTSISDIQRMVNEYQPLTARSQRPRDNSIFPGDWPLNVYGGNILAWWHYPLSFERRLQSYINFGGW